MREFSENSRGFLLREDDGTTFNVRLSDIFDRGSYFPTLKTPLRPASYQASQSSIDECRILAYD